MSKDVHRPEPGSTTPGGGVIAEVFYFDEHGCPTDRQHAVRVIVRELDEEGNLVCETFATVNQNGRSRAPRG
jgi:hypothetical protein